MRFSESDWLQCCGSSKFAKEMAKIGPFQSLAEAIEISREIWWNQVDVPGWIEAFGAHPRIGGLHNKSPANWCSQEQAAAMETANDRALKDLGEWNRVYESKFGFVFLVCATGKSSSEILELLKARLMNRPLVELQVAANEQQKITELRLLKLVAGDKETVSKVKSPTSSRVRPSLEQPSEILPSSQPGTFRTGDAKADGRLNKIEAHVSGQQQKPLRPPITTHVLDVSLGKPASGLEISLEHLKHEQVSGNSSWIPIGTSVTNQDGRSGPLMEASEKIEPGVYRITFNTGGYHSSTTSSDSGPFYPYVSIVFDIKPSQVFQHFHVPLLLSPFSYTTYRGS